MPDDQFSKGAVTASENTKISLKSSLIGSFFLNFLFKGAFHMMLSLINTLQLVLHFPIMKIVLPANIIAVFSVLIPIVQFDLLEDLQIFKLMFPLSEIDAEQYLSELG